MDISTRHNDDDHITISKEDFVQIARNGDAKGSGFKEWVRIIFAVAVPVIVLITFFNQTAFQVERNTEDLKKHELWIEENANDTASIKQSIADIGKQQAVILEKVVRVQQDIERLSVTQ